MPESNKRGLPWFMILWSIVVLSAAILPRIYIAEVEDATGLGLDVIGFASMGLFALFFLSWTIWCLFFSGWKWWRRLFGAVLTQAIPVGFIALIALGYLETAGGDVNVLRWRRERAKLTTEVTPSVGVNLTEVSATDFPGYFGPNGSGVVDSVEIDAERFSEATTLWKKSIGEGWSGFSVRNGFAVTMEQRDVFECVTCYKVESGDLEWIYKHETRHDDFMGKAGPRATPTIHNGKVYAVGSLGNLVCLNGSNGSVVWQKDVNEIIGVTIGPSSGPGGTEFQVETNTTMQWGRAGSPLIVDGMVIVPGGATGKKVDGVWVQDPGAATLLAFDADTGELKWKGGDQMIGYASPQVATLGGRKQIIITAEAMIIGVDAATGEQLWSHPRPGQSNGMANTSQLSILGDDQLLSAKGYPDGGGELLTIETRSGKFIPVSEWKNTRILKTKLTSPIVYDGHAYALSNGFMECSRVSDGKRMWKNRAKASSRYGHGQSILVGDKLLLHTEETQKLLLIQATPDAYTQLGELDTGLEGICWNTLCISGSKLLIRSDTEAACIELPVSDKADPSKDDGENKKQEAVTQ